MSNLTANDSNGNNVEETDEGPSASTLYLSEDSIDADGSSICISDAYNNRVLIWNSWPTENAQPADIVLGQIDFDSDTTLPDTDGNPSVLSAQNINYPTGCGFIGNDLWVNSYYRTVRYTAF